MGLPGCVMYAGATVFDLVLPKIAADVPSHAQISRRSAKAGYALGASRATIRSARLENKTSKRWRSHRFEGGDSLLRALACACTLAG